MVLPLIPIAIAGAGGLGGFGLGSLFGKGKKEEVHAPYEYYAPTTSVIEAEPYQHFAPQVQFAPITSYAYQGATTIISSPGAVAKKIISQEAISKPEQAGRWDFPVSVTQAPEHKPGDVSGTNLTHIALIAVVGAAAIMFIKKKK